MVVQVIEAAKKRGQEKAKLTKSMIILDVKPWDDTTGIVPSQSFHNNILGSKAVLIQSLELCHLQLY